MIEKISEKDAETATVKLIEGFDHQFQEGDSVMFEKIEGMDLQSSQIDSSGNASINGQTVKVTKVVNRQIFEVALTCSKYSEYKSQGLVKFVKTPKILNFKPLADYYKIYDDLEGSEDISLQKIEEAQAKSGFFDENLIWADFEKL